MSSSSESDFENDPPANDTSTDEDDDAILLDSKVSSEILSTLAAIKSKDSSLLDPSKQFYTQPDEDQLTKVLEARKSSPDNTITLKDYEHSMLLKDLPDEEQLDKQHTDKMNKDTQEEKEALRQALEDDSDSELFEQKSLVPTDPDTEAKEVAKTEAKEEMPLDIVDKVFDGTTEEDQFLKDYILNEKWKGNVNINDQVFDEVEKDYQDVAVENDFEEDFNFRFEDQIVGHSRIIEGSVRSTKSKRARQREAKRERKRALEEQNVKTTKDAKVEKRKELMAKLTALEGILGIVFNNEVVETPEDFLDGEFDDEKFDDFVEENFEKFGNNFDDLESEVRSRLGTIKETFNNQTNQSDLIDEEELIRKEVEIERLLDDYLSLDYEDVVGDVKCRFKYKNVDAEDFGLDVLDILNTPDSELNKTVGLKLLAPYREKKEGKSLKRAGVERGKRRSFGRYSSSKKRSRI
ncbi:hypothetical protein P9112_008682 [Eukaryota sp. TZLM1-RC]